MVSIDFNNTQANYYEFILSRPDLTLEDAKKCMSVLSNRNFKYFQKTFKEQIWNTSYYQNYDNDDIKVIKKDVVSIENDMKKHMIVVGYNKSKLSLLNIPSSLDFYASYHVSRLTFRVSNRIYVNIEVKNSANKKQSVKIYVNYNHDTNVDTTLIEKQLNEVINLLVQQ